MISRWSTVKGLFETEPSTIDSCRPNAGQKATMQNIFIATITENMYHHVRPVEFQSTWCVP